MVKIRLLDDPDAPDEEEAFLTLEKHGDGFVVALVDSDGDKVGAPFVLFLEPNSQGKLVLILASSVNDDFIARSTLNNTIVVNPSR